MTTWVESVATPHTPESLAASLRRDPGLVLLRSSGFDLPQAHLSLVVARPFLSLRAHGSRCRLSHATGGSTEHFGNPWRLIDSLLARYELLDEVDAPFPSGGAFGYWGYDLRRFVEPRLVRGPVDDLELPDAVLGFHDSLVVFDHRAGRTWIVSTGLQPDGSRSQRRAQEMRDSWKRRLETPPSPEEEWNLPVRALPRASEPGGATGGWSSSVTRDGFIDAVARAQRYIRAGDIYQVNLAQRLSAPWHEGGWNLFLRLMNRAGAPFSAFMDAGDFQIASISPEQFLRLSGSHAVTRPIKGTRPRSADPTRDAQLTYELQTSGKEHAELVMITDLLRNDLGRISEFGSIQVPDLMRLEKFPEVQHLVSTVEGTLRRGMTHAAALESCFPGGSITGAPKIRAMEVIDELEPVSRGPYTGCAGYLGFNRESQLNILIRSAVVRGTRSWYHAGAGIVADSDPAAEYDETLAKARAYLDVSRAGSPSCEPARPTMPARGGSPS